MLRTIQEIRPAWVIGENVAGILTMVQPGKETEVGSQTSLFGEDNRKRILLRQEYVVETICKDLEREGYSVQPLLIPACAVGAPHRRDRVWFVAHRTDARLEDVRRTREDDILSAGNVTDSNSKKLQERIKVRRRKNQEKAGTRVDDGVERFGNMRYAPYSDNERLQVFNISQRNDAEKRKIEERYLEQYSSDVRRALHSTPWDDFPTQSPVCRGNDGVPVNVDNLTIPFTKWRQESIKGYGNAIVPQVILEIFKAIEEIEQSE